MVRSTPDRLLPRMTAFGEPPLTAAPDTWSESPRKLASWPESPADVASVAVIWEPGPGATCRFTSMPATTLRPQASEAAPAPAGSNTLFEMLALLGHTTLFVQSS